MEREYTYSKARLRYVIEQILDRDILGNPEYMTEDRAVEGFEKRAVLEFLGWFLEQAFPEDFAFACTFEDLEDDYPEPIARRISRAGDWAPSGDLPAGGELIEVDFRASRPPDSRSDADGPDDA